MHRGEVERARGAQDVPSGGGMRRRRSGGIKVAVEHAGGAEVAVRHAGGTVVVKRDAEVVWMLSRGGWDTEPRRALQAMS